MGFRVQCFHEDSNLGFRDFTPVLCHLSYRSLTVTQLAEGR